MTSRPYTPRVYQRPITRHILEHDRCAIWGTPGVGKTAPTLTALKIMSMTDEPNPMLILGPLRPARSVWTEEAAKWDHLADFEVVSLVGDQRHRKRAVRYDAPVFTLNYESLPWLIDYWGERWPYRVVIADEADNLKSNRVHFETARKKDGSPGATFLKCDPKAGGKRANALAMIAHKKIRRFVELTGTPAANGLKDLWGQLWFLDAGQRLGKSHTAFMMRWFETGFDGYTITPKECAQAQIQAAVRDICLTIDAKDYFDLKDPVLVPRVVTLPPAARKMYREMEREFLVEIADRRISAVNTGVKTQKLLQIATGACYLDPGEDVVEPMARREWQEIHDVKLRELADLIGELNGATVIVVYEFWSDLQRLKKAFPAGRALASKRDEDDFKAGKVPILFVHPKSAGHGIDGFQHVCHHMIFLSHGWALGAYLQLIERIGPTRQMQGGYDRNVFLYFLIAADTIDEDVMESRAGKREVQEILLESCKRRQDGRPSAWRESQEIAP